MNGATPLVLGPGAGDTVRNPVGGIVTFKATGAVTAGRLAAFEERDRAR